MKITPRKGISEKTLETVRYWTPLRAPDLWLTREDAAAALGVGPRTIDRYTRKGRITTYVGPVEGSLRGVRVLKSEVDEWDRINVKAVGGGD